MTLPLNLRKLCITSLDSAEFISDEMVRLEYLQLELPQMESFEETGIVAPNLKTTDCEKLSDFRNLEQFKLKVLFLTNCGYPFGLFKDNFSMLERFEYDGNGFIDLENFETPLLSFLQI